MCQITRLRTASARKTQEPQAYKTIYGAAYLSGRSTETDTVNVPLFSDTEPWYMRALPVAVRFRRLIECIGSTGNAANDGCFYRVENAIEPFFKRSIRMREWGVAGDNAKASSSVSADPRSVKWPIARSARC